MHITTIIPTLDEELHIARCVTSALPLGPVWVVDANSTDNTVGAARRAGANVVVQEWLGHAGQKNWALDTLSIETPWVLFLDADEFLPAELRSEISARVSEPVVAFQVARQFIFFGRQLRYSYWYPDYQLRLFRLGHARYEQRSVHEHMIVAGGETGTLSAPLVHENLKGVEAYFHRLLRYAKLEAEIMRETRPLQADGIRLATGRARARRAVKENIWYSLPNRPAIRYVWRYLLRGGFRDGVEGRIFLQMMSAYEAMIDAMFFELGTRHHSAQAAPRHSETRDKRKI